MLINEQRHTKTKHRANNHNLEIRRARSCEAIAEHGKLNRQHRLSEKNEVDIWTIIMCDIIRLI